MQKLGAAFPAAKIIVTGYYPLVSAESDATQLLQFATKVVQAAVAEGVSLAEDLLRLVTAPFAKTLALAAPTKWGSFAAPIRSLRS